MNTRTQSLGPGFKSLGAPLSRVCQITEMIAVSVDLVKNFGKPAIQCMTEPKHAYVQTC